MNGLPRERAPDPASVPADSPDPTAGDRYEDDSPYDPGGADWTGLADAAWLAAARLEARRTPGPVPDHPSHAGRHPDTSGPGQPSPAGPPPAGGPDPLPGPVPRTPSDPAPDAVPGVSGLPGPPAYEREIRTVQERTRTGPDRLPGPRPRAVRTAPPRLARSLRGLGRRVPTGGRSALDEESTAEHGLTDGLWVPYFLPDRERAFDLVLLVDRAPTMPPWGATVRQIADEAARSGAFRDVRTVGVTLPAGAANPRCAGPAGATATPPNCSTAAAHGSSSSSRTGSPTAGRATGPTAYWNGSRPAGPPRSSTSCRPTCATAPRCSPSAPNWTPEASARRTAGSASARRSARPTPSGRCPNRTTTPCPYRCSACAPGPSAPGPTW